MVDNIRKEMVELLRTAEALSADVSATVEELLREGLEKPLSADEIRVLLTKVVEAIQTGAKLRGEADTAEILGPRSRGIDRASGRFTRSVVIKWNSERYGD